MAAKFNIQIKVYPVWRVSNKGKISYPSRTSRAGSMIRRWWSTSWRKFGACWTGPVAFPASSTVSASRWATSWAWFRTFHRSPGTSVSLAPLDSLSSNSNLPKGKNFTFFSIFLAVIYRIGKIGWMDGSMSKKFSRLNNATRLAWLSLTVSRPISMLN